MQKSSASLSHSIMALGAESTIVGSIPSICTLLDFFITLIFVSNFKVLYVGKKYYWTDPH